MLVKIEVKTGGYEEYPAPRGTWAWAHGMPWKRYFTKTVVINPKNIDFIDIDEGIIEMDNGEEYEVADGIDDELLEKLGIVE